MTLLDLFRWIGRLEGSSFLILLGIAMPLKYLANYPQAVSVVGMAHGILFMLYLLTANYAATKYSWTKRSWFLCYLAAILPLGTFYYEHKFLPKTHPKA